MMAGTMRIRRRTIRRGLQRARAACTAAAAGRSGAGTAGRRYRATAAARGSRGGDLGFRVSLVPADK